MAKLERRIAFYEDGHQEVGKTTRKTFNTDGLVGVVCFYDDGTRTKEPVQATERLSKRVSDRKAVLTHIESAMGFKSDGGETPEVRESRRVN